MPCNQSKSICLFLKSKRKWRVPSPLCFVCYFILCSCYKHKSLSKIYQNSFFHILGSILLFIAFFFFFGLACCRFYVIYVGLVQILWAGIFPLFLHGEMDWKNCFSHVRVSIDFNRRNPLLIRHKALLFRRKLVQFRGH